MKSLFLCSLGVGLVAVPLLAACGDDAGSGGSGTSASSVTGPTNGSSSSSKATSSTSDTSSSSSGMQGCTELTTDDWKRINEAPVAPFFFYQSQPMIGGPEEDVVRLEFYADPLSDTTGTIDLGAAPNDTYETCEVCLFIGQDIMQDDSTTYFFVSAGTLELGASSPPFIDGMLTNVTLIEVTIDQMTFVTTPVPNGDCYHLASATLSFEAPSNQWNCDPLYFAINDPEDCDCGCGQTDPDCADMTAAVCDYCNNVGSCAEMEMDCATINMTNNAVCM